MKNLMLSKNQRKVLFIYPENESLGIQILSAVLKKHGHLTDLIIDPRLFSDLEFNVKFLAKKFKFVPNALDRIEKYKPDLIAFSVVTDDYIWACQIARDIKNKYKNIPIVFGGIHPTAVPERVLKNDFVDFVVVGEGEYALLELVNNLDDQKSWSMIRNLYYKFDHQIFKNEIRPLVSNLDDLPQPDKSLFYEKVPYHQSRYLIMTGRGCPYLCTYCCNSLLRQMYKKKGPYLRRRSVERVIEELENAKKKYKVKEIYFYDDHFVSKDKWLIKFLDEYKKKIGLPYRCFAIAKYFNEDSIDLLKNSEHCKFVQIGIQSVNDRIRRDICHRGDDNNKIAWVVDKLRGAGISVIIDHIFGFPSETIDDQIDAAKYYNKIQPSVINTFWLTYYPKTKIIDIAKSYGLISNEDIEHIEEGNFQKRQEPSNVEALEHFRESLKFQVLFNFIPILPKKVNSFIINKKIYKLFLNSHFFRVNLQRAILIIFNESFQNAAIKKLGKYYYFLKPI